MKVLTLVLCGVLLLLLPVQGWAAIAVPTHAENVDTDQNESVNCTVPSGLASGDLWLIVVAVDNDAGAGMPANATGFTAVDAGVQDATDGTATRAFWKIATGSDSTVAVTPASGNWYQATCESIRITGAHATTPIGNVAVNNPAGGGANIASASVTIQDTGNMVVVFLAGSASIAPITKPTALTLIDGDVSTWPAISVAYATGLATGAYDPGAWTNTSADPAYSQTIEIRIAAVGGGPTPPPLGTLGLMGVGR